MEYFDENLSTNEEFEKINNEMHLNVPKQAVDNIAYNLKYLVWLYGYAKRRVNSNKLKNALSKLAEQSENSFNMFCEIFPETKNVRLKNLKRFKSLISCARVAIFTECEIVENLIKNFKYIDIYNYIILNSLNNIKLLSTY